MPPLHAQLERLITSRAGTLRGAARRACANPEDAADAVQRAVEIALTKAPQPLDDEALTAWLVVVTRREALRLARTRRLAGREQGEPVCAGSDPAEQWLLRRSAGERLALLKADERLALLLRAAGFSYREIAERQGWTYTKVNRALAEGRARLREAGPG